MPRGDRRESSFYDEAIPKEYDSIVKDSIDTDVSHAEVETNGPETKNGTIVGASNVNVRKEPRLGSEVLVILEKGDHVTITDRIDDFYKVLTDKKIKGYILSDFVKEE